MSRASQYAVMMLTVAVFVGGSLNLFERAKRVQETGRGYALATSTNLNAAAKALDSLGR